MGANISGFESAMGTVSQRMNAIDRDVNKTFSGLSSMGGNLAALGAGLTGAITLPLAGIATAAIQVSEQLNMARLSFTTMLGSAQAATQFLGELQTFAAKTPFEFPELVDAAKRMQAMGFEASQVIPTLRTIGDAAAALGGGKSVIDGLTTALGQMQAKGKVSAQEMNQLAERGVPAWQILADQIGVSIPQAMKLAEQGAISAAVAVPAILAGMNEKFGGQMAAASQTLTGVWSNFKDQATLTLAEIGNTLAPVVKSALEAAQPLLTWAKDSAIWFAALPEPVRNTAIGFLAFGAAIGPIVGTVGLMMGSVSTIVTGFTQVNALFGAGGIAAKFTGVGTAISGILPSLSTMAAGLTGAGGISGAFSAAGGAISAFGGGLVAAITSPVGIAVAAIAALGAIGYVIYDNWTDIKNTLGALWTDLTTLGTTVWGGFTTWLGGIWAPIGGFFSSAWEGISSTLTGAWNAIAGSTEGIWKPIASFLGTVWDGVALGFTTVWNSVSTFLSDTWNSIAGTAKEIWDSITGKISGALETLAKAFPNTKLALQNWGTEAEDAKKKNEALEKSSKDLKASTDKVKTALKSSGFELGKLATGTTAYESAVKKLDTQQIAYLAKLADTKTKLKESKEKYDAFTASILDGRAADEALVLMGNIAAISRETLNLKNLAVPVFTNDLTPALTAALGKAGGFTEALKTLGVDGKRDLQTIATEAAKARDTVLGSDLATDFEKKSAVYKALEAQVAAAKQAGLDIPKDQLATLAKMKTDLEGPSGVPALKGAWSTFGTEVSTIFTNFTQSIGKSLFEGDLSFGEKGKAMLKSLGEAATSLFIKPFTDGLSAMMSGVITDLLGGKGLGGVSDALAGLGGKLGDIFGGGAAKVAAGASDDLGSIPGKIPGGGGGGVASAASGGLSATLGAIFSGVSMVSDIFGNFQNARQETTLNAIESNTRDSEAHLLTLVDKSNIYWPELSKITGAWKLFLDNHAYRLEDIWLSLGRLVDIRADTLAIVSKLGNIFDALGTGDPEALDRTTLIDTIRNGFLETAINTKNIIQDMSDASLSMAQMAGAGSGPAIEINMNGIMIGEMAFVDRIASAVAAKVRTQGGYA